MEPLRRIYRKARSIAGRIRRRASPPDWRAPKWENSSWAELLSRSPLIIHCFTGIGFPLGAASALGPRLRDEKVHFLVMPSSSLDYPDGPENLAATGKAYLSGHPRHKITFVCNTEKQTERIRRRRAAAITVNQNCFVNDEQFHPLPGIAPVYDAVYNARLSPEKRHELAVEVPSLALIYFYDWLEPVAEFHARHARLRQMMPEATFVNPLTSDGSRWMMGDEINRVLAQSHAGLCLSRDEGAMRVAIEYLFAGLPVVETPSGGGRDYFFDKEYCITVEPDPRSVRDAVAALVARDIPRDHIRTKTLAKVERERRRYIDFVQGLIDRDGGRERFEDRFWRFTRGDTIVRWRPMKTFLDEIRRDVSEFRRESR